MDTYESSVKKVNSKASDIYKVVSNMSNLAKMKEMIPASLKEEHADKMKIVDSMECTADAAYFEAPMVGRMGLVIVDREENKVVKYGGDPTPFEFNLWIQMKEVSENESAIKLTLKADLPFVIKMMAGSKLKDGIEKVADKIAQIDYSALGAKLV